MENRERKIGWKMEFFTIWLRGGGGEKSGGPTNFLSSPFKIQSLQIGVKSRKNIWTKLPPPLINVSDFFFFFYFSFVTLACSFLFFFSFFSFDFSFVMLAFWFCFLIFFFLGFVMWWVLLLFLLLFLLNFFF